MPVLTLKVEGWRGINHSFALVNQFHLLELAKRVDVNLSHLDAAFHYGHWSKTVNGAGFHQDDEAVLDGLTLAAEDQSSDWTYRIYSPVNITPARIGERVLVFGVSECGLDDKFFADGFDVSLFEKSGGLIATPSNWSRNLFLQFGFSETTVHTIPHGVSRKYFFPLSPETNLVQRQALGFRDDETLLLNIGAPMWNKGIDLLVQAFAIARQQRKDLRLIFKDQRNTYGLSSEAYVQSILQNQGLLSADALNSITLIPANLTMDQVNSMYGVADCYVSPYRAEGFNLPVCEAMACGLPVIVTAGGATDDFVAGEIHTKVHSTEHMNVTVQGRLVTAYREPDMDALVEALLAVRQKTALGKVSPSNFETVSWSTPVDQMLDLMRQV